MKFLINPSHKRRGTKGKTSRRKVRRRRVRRAGQAQAKGVSVARRRRRRSVRHSAPRRRRRRSVVALRSNPPRRRRRRHVRHYRRNPVGVRSTGVVGTIKQGVKDGALVLAGQTAQGRLSSLVSKVIPISGIAGEAVSGIGSAVVVAIASRKVAPGLSRMLTAGAFANAVKRIVTAVSPSVGGMLGDGEEQYYIPSAGGGAMGAYVEDYSHAGGMGAYPGGGLGDSADEFSHSYVS